MLLSVIVPIYNVEDYLEECLNSLVKQTLQDMEVILVNDGSKDHSEEIAETFVARYPEKFTLLKKENGGLSDARNFGVPYAKGQYLAFLDSDDFVEETYYEQMVQKMQEGSYDIVVSDIQCYYPQDSNRNYIMKGLCDWKFETVQKQALLSPLFAWNKLYVTKRFQEEGYQFPLNKWYEDIPVTTLYFAKSAKIGYVQDALVYYRQREGSIMHVEDNPKLADIFDIMALLRENFEQAGLSDQYQEELEYLHIEHLRLYGMFRFIRSNEKTKYYNMTQGVMLTCFPNWKKNPYIKNLSKKNRTFLKYYNKATAWLFDRYIR